MLQILVLLSKIVTSLLALNITYLINAYTQKEWHSIILGNNLFSYLAILILFLEGYVSTCA